MRSHSFAVSFVASVLAVSAGAPRAGAQDGGAPPDGAGREAIRPGESSQARWDRLRTEFLEIAGPLEHLLGRPDQPQSGTSITAKMAEGAYLRAKLEREVAEIELKDYDEGTAVAEREGARGGVAGAQDALKVVEDRLAREKSALKQVNSAIAARGNTPTPQDIAAKLTVVNALARDERERVAARFALQAAETEQQVLIKFGQKRRRLELQAAVEKARAEELKCQSAWESAKAEEPRKGLKASGSGLSPEERKALALLAEAVRPPADPGRERFSAFLDRLESARKEARRLTEPTRARRKDEWFVRVAARVHVSQENPAGPDRPGQPTGSK